MDKLRTNNEKLSDSTLWNQLRAGDEEAFSLLFEKYYSPLVNYGKTLRSEGDIVKDCVQDAFVDIWTYRSKLNEAIADMYETWHVELKNGKTLEGIITDRTSASYTLKMMGGQEQIITKKEVKNMKALNTSSMPEGLENAISLTDMADLLAFIKYLK